MRLGDPRPPALGRQARQIGLQIIMTKGYLPSAGAVSSCARLPMRLDRHTALNSKSFLVDFHGVTANINRMAAEAMLTKSANQLRVTPSVLLNQLFFSNPHSDDVDSGRLSYKEMLASVKNNHWKGSLETWLSLWEGIWTFYRPNKSVMRLIRRCAKEHVDVLVVTDNHTQFRSWLSATPQFSSLACRLLCSGEIGVTKRHCGFFERAAQIVNKPLDQCVYLDDDPENISRAGLLGICAHHFRFSHAADDVSAVEKDLFGS